MAGMLLFLLPYFLLNDLNQNFTGISSDKLYSQQDYNAQHELWGTHFTESTKGGMLVTSLHPPMHTQRQQSFAHVFRDLLMQFENYNLILFSHGINPRILGCSIFAIPITFILFIGLWKIRLFVSKRQIVLFFTLFIVPFVGFALISYRHGYNYLIYPSYMRIAMIFLIFGLSYFVCSNKIISFNWLEILLAFLYTADYFLIKSFCRAVKDSFFIRFPLNTNINRNWNKRVHRVSQRIEHDFNSSFGITRFFCRY